MRSRGVSNTWCSAIVSSTVPRFDERWPPVLETLCSTNSRSCPASTLRSARERRRTSAGLLIDSRSLYVTVGFSVLAIDHAVGQHVQALHVGLGEAARLERG